MASRREEEQDTREDLDDSVNDAKSDLADAAEKAKDRIGAVGSRISDEIEERIPGDSDHDGH